MDAKRLKIISELFGDSKGFLPQSRLMKYNAKLNFVPTDRLIEFSLFADKFRNAYQNTDTLLHKASLAWNKQIFLTMRQKGVRYFKSVEEVAEFCSEAYRGERLCSCGSGSGFMDFVVISVDEDGNLRNNYVVLENGTFKRLDSNESATLYTWLFENQDRIGVIKQVSTNSKKEETGKCEPNTLNMLSTDPDAILPIHPKIKQMLSKTNKAS